MRHARFAKWLLLIAAAGAGAGCGSDGFVLAPVSGRVTVDGEPVAGLRVSFEPMGSESKASVGPESVGITDDDGRYTLATLSESPRRGGVVGKCRVRIRSLPAKQVDGLAEKRAAALSNDRDPNYDPIKEIKVLKEQLRNERRKKAQPAAGAVPLRFNDRTELSFDVPPGGTDKANFQISWK